MKYNHKDILMWAEAVNYSKELTEEQVLISEEMDKLARSIGETGNDKDMIIAQFIQKTLEPTITEKLDEAMEMIFELGNIGEFDKTMYYKDKGNTLVAYDCTIGGNVPKSYIDVQALEAQQGHCQVETHVTYAELRRDGFRSIAKLVTYAEEALMVKIYSNVLNAVTTAIAGGTQAIVESGAMPTLTSMDKLALNLKEYGRAGDTPVIITQNKYAQGIARMNSLNPFLSNEQKAVYAKFGFATEYASIPVKAYSGVRKTIEGNIVVPDKTILGFAGKIGELNMRGSIRVYETMDNNRERVELKITGASYEFVINEIEKASKITIQG